MTSLNIQNFGPYRTIGLRYAGKNANGEIGEQLWPIFTSRAKEIAAPGPGAFGICRCLPGAADGSFEYFATIPVAPDSPLPQGMVEVQIPECEYAVFPVKNLKEIMQTWKDAAAAIGVSSEWVKPYCGPDGCECATNPCFEYYPPEFQGEGPFFIYMPVRRR